MKNVASLTIQQLFQKLICYLLYIYICVPVQRVMSAALIHQYDNRHGFCTADFDIHWLCQGMDPHQYYHSRKTVCDPEQDKQKPSPKVLQLSLADSLINPGASALEVLHTLPKPCKQKSYKINQQCEMPDEMTSHTHFHDTSSPPCYIMRRSLHFLVLCFH